MITFWRISSASNVCQRQISNINRRNHSHRANGDRTDQETVRRVCETPSLEAGSYGDRDTLHCTVQSGHQRRKQKKRTSDHTSHFQRCHVQILQQAHRPSLMQPRSPFFSLVSQPTPLNPHHHLMLLKYSFLSVPWTHGSPSMGWTSWLAQAASSVLPLPPKGFQLSSLLEDDTRCIFRHQPKNSDLLTVDTS